MSLSPKLGPSIEAMPMVLCIGQCTIQPGWAQRRVKCIVRRANNRGCRPPHLTSRHSSSVDPFQHSAKSPLPCVSLIGLRHILYFCVPEMVLMQYTHKIQNKPNISLIAIEIKMIAGFVAGSTSSLGSLSCGSVLVFSGRRTSTLIGRSRPPFNW